MYCMFCGKENADGAMFCQYCGKKQTDTSLSFYNLKNKVNKVLKEELEIDTDELKAQATAQFSEAKKEVASAIKTVKEEIQAELKENDATAAVDVVLSSEEEIVEQPIKSVETKKEDRGKSNYHGPSYSGRSYTNDSSQNNTNGNFSKSVMDKLTPNPKKIPVQNWIIGLGALLVLIIIALASFVVTSNDTAPAQSEPVIDITEDIIFEEETADIVEEEIQPSVNSIFDQAFVISGKEYNTYYIFDFDDNYGETFSVYPGENLVNISPVQISGNIWERFDLYYFWYEDSDWHEQFKFDNTAAELEDYSGFKIELEHADINEVETILSSIEELEYPEGCENKHLK